MASGVARFYSGGGQPDDVAVVGGVVYTSLLSRGAVVAVATNGVATTVASGLSEPEGIAGAPANELYVVEQGHNRIDRISLDGKATVSVVARFSNQTGAAGIDSIHLVPSGHILVPDSPNGSLIELDPATGATHSLATGLGRPVDAIAYQGGYAVADETQGLVLIAPGAPLHGPFTHQALPGADDLALTAEGDLLVTGLTNGAVYAYRGGRLDKLVGGFSDPQGMALLADGSLLIADSGKGVIVHLPRACVEG